MINEHRSTKQRALWWVHLRINLLLCDGREKNWTVFTNIKQRKYFRAKWIFGILKLSRLTENSTNYNIKVQEWVHNSDELKFVLVHHYYRYCFQSCLSVSLSQSDHTWTCSNIVSGPQPPKPHGYPQHLFKLVHYVAHTSVGKWKVGLLVNGHLIDIKVE